MYTVCTQGLIRDFHLPFLDPIPTVFIWIALGAWGLTFTGLGRHLVGRNAEGLDRTQRGPAAQQQANVQQGEMAG
jgi:hypothetical protein